MITLVFVVVVKIFDYLKIDDACEIIWNRPLFSISIYEKAKQMNQVYHSQCN